MALTKGDIHLWDRLRKMQVIPSNPHVLELGEANWHGDVPLPPEIVCENPHDPFAVARAFYQHILNPATLTSIDMDGTEDAIKLNLNKWQFLRLPNCPFDITINSGTAEHVFNQANFFRIMHEWTKPAGLMVHATPIGAGWHSHGLYIHTIELFGLLALANEYSTLLTFYLDVDTGHIGNDVSLYARSVMYVAFRKEQDSTFRYPVQTPKRISDHPHFFDGIPGWFGPQDGYLQVYADAVRTAPLCAVFVEVGCWLGRSTAFLAVEIANSKKVIGLFVVDTFCTPGNEEMVNELAAHDGNVRAAFEANMSRSPTPVSVLECASTEAAANFIDASLEFCFIDASHDYESVKADILAWLPKIRPGGTLAGHDYDSETDPGVVQAVNECLAGRFFVFGRCWIVRV